MDWYSEHPSDGNNSTSLYNSTRRRGLEKENGDNASPKNHSTVGVMKDATLVTTTIVMNPPPSGLLMVM